MGPTVERLGKYEIISEIGHGAMGSVYKARDPLIGRLVALKTITSGVSGQPNSLERFYQEARSAGALQHPNIVTIYELGHENDTPFIAMEYIEGDSLDHLIEQHQVLPLWVKLGYMLRVCEALSHAHHHNVIHRDVKPANIMVTKEGGIKVVDFGIARLMDMSLTQPNMMIGSRAYMSPQLYKGERADARADIWAVGVTLYELLTGRRPFEGDSEAELMFRIISDNPAPLLSLAPECPQALAAAVERMLEKEAEARYQSTDDVIRDLEPIWKSEQQATVAGLLADCEQLVQANDLPRAQAMLRKTLQIDTGNTQAKSLLEKVTLELRRSQVLPKINAVNHAQDPAVKNLPNLALDAEREQQKARRPIEGISAVRALLGDEKYAEALTKGKALLREYPEEFELREIVDYAREEAAQQEQRLREKAWEKQIRSLMEMEKYQEAEVLANRAAQGLPHMELFRKLAEEARQKKALHEQNARAREELRRRIEEIRSNLQQEKTGDAIRLVQQTLAAFGPNDHLTELLNLATAKQEEQKKKEKQEQHLAEAGAMVAAGNFSEAKQLLNQAIATQIFEPSDPRVQQRLREIEQLSAPAVTPPVDKKPSEAKEAMRAADLSNAATTQPRAPSPAPADSLLSDSVPPGLPGTPQAGPATTGTRRSSQQRPTPRAGTAVSAPPTEKVKAKERAEPPAAIERGPARGGNAWQSQIAEIAPFFRKPIVWGVAGGLALVLIVTLVVVTRGPSKQEKELRSRAMQLWSAHQLDESQQAWQKLEELNGAYQKEAARQLKEIENKRQQEAQRFQEGESLLNNQKDYPGATQAFNEVVQMNLWLADQARSELDRAKAMGGEQDVRNFEQQHFNQGKGFFDARNFDEARKEFQAARDLNVPNSPLGPEIDSYLKKIAQNADAKKLYDLALEDIKNEKWENASHELQELVDRKAAMSGEAKKRLENVAVAQKAEDAFRRSLQGGAYLTAKSQLDAMRQWPKTQERLRKDLLAAEHQEANALQSRANSLQASSDLAGLEALQAELHKFASRVEDPSLMKWAKETLDPWLSSEEQKIREKQGDKAAFDAAVTDFKQAKEKFDVDRMEHEVLPKFQKLAKGSGALRADAQLYVDKTIPSAIDEMQKTIGKGRILVPQISCTAGPAGATGAPPATGKQNPVCAQLDPDSPFQWIGRPTVELPASANQPGRLPYTLELIVFVDASGKVTKIEKQGEADKDFFKKAKEASKNWRTTVPKYKGNPISVNFPLAITFHQ